LDEKLIVTLEQSLRLTRADQRRLLAERDELRAVNEDVTPEEESLTRNIEALESAAKQTESAIYSLLAAMRKNKN